MAKCVEVGFAVYISKLWESGHELDQYKEMAITGFKYTARAHRILPDIEGIRVYIRPPRPDSPDPFDAIGSVGYKGYGNHLPWYKGWLDMLWAWYQLRRRGLIGG